ncbi:hypothetical protein ACFVAV_08020 [Nocardia sp. NPDC057663]|uniref:hypothetical protein n=1 Tax=Nocardia sp. NPDC057663 TaxID=3346201 RepID=UPI00366D5473
MTSLREARAPDTDPETAARTATLVIATMRGLLLDLLATGDRRRVQDAADSQSPHRSGQESAGTHGRADAG